MYVNISIPTNLLAICSFISKFMKQNHLEAITFLLDLISMSMQNFRSEMLTLTKNNQNYTIKIIIVK